MKIGKIKRQFFFVAALLLVAAFCFGSGQQEAAEKEVKVVLDWIIELEWREPAIEIIEKFEAENPNISINEIKVGSQEQVDAEKKQLQMIGGGNPPDILYITSTEMLAYVSSGSALDLSPYLSEDEKSQWYDAVVDAGSYKGKMYGVPAQLWTMAVIYNEDLIAEVGAETPSEDWTWDEFLTTAQKLTEGSGPTKRYGMNATDYWGYWFPFIWQAGGRTLNDDKTKSALDSPEALEAFQFVYDMIWKHEVAPSGPDKAGREDGQMLISENLAMAIDGTWRVPQLVSEGQSLNWNVQTLPQNKEKAVYGGITFHGVHSDSENVEAAAKFVKFIGTVEAGVSYGKYGFIHPSKDPAPQDMFAKDLPDGVTHYAKNAEYLKWEWITPKWPNIRPIYAKELGKLWNQGQSPGDTVNTLVKGINKVLSE